VFLLRLWPIPPVFGWIQRLGDISREELYRVFNMGIGFVVIVSPYFAESIQRQLAEERVPAFVIGEVREGETGVEWC
jgi:phosphoribosylformylglycinamidine cyclo-ligase